MVATEFVRPDSLDEAIAIMAGAPGEWTPIAGGTDLLVRARDGHGPARLLDLGRIAELSGIRVGDGVLRVGALVTHSELASDPLVRRHALALAEAAAAVGSPAIRNRGTIGGNLANASPAGDTIPPLVALDASVVLAGPGGRRTVRAEGLATGPGRTVLAPGELIVAVLVPIETQGRASAFRRLGTRAALAIAKVSVAVAAAVGPGGVLSRVRVALGAVAPTVVRSPAAEAVLEGRVPDGAVLDAAAAAACKDARPISDIRSNETYRREMCGVLLRRAVSALRG